MLCMVIALAILLAIYICYQDIRHGIIRNRLILALLLLGIIYQAASGTLFTSTLPVLSTLAYGFLIAFLFWWLGLWPGGDAKLFTALLLFFPAELYSTGLILPYLANAFIPLFAFMVAYALFKSRPNIIVRALNYSLNPYKVSFIFIILIGFMWFFTGLIRLAGIQADYFITILMLFAIYELFSATISAKTEALFTGLVLIRAILDFQNLFALASLYYFLLVAGVFVFFRFFLLYIAYYTFTTEIGINRLRPGMILAEGISPEGKGYARISFLNSSLVEFLQQKRRRFIHGLDELTRKDVNRIKRLRKQGRIMFGRVRVCQTQPFAAFILVGYLLTLLFQGGLPIPV
jgi:Flp pilus assembly protein protease CpaA